MSTKGIIKATSLLALFALALFPELALAQSSGFDQVGRSGLDAVCAFTKSPMITLIAAFAFLSALVAVVLNEDNRLLGWILKIVMGVICILYLPALLSLLGLGGFQC